MAIRINGVGERSGATGGACRALGNPGALAAARARPMSERLELALSWNAVAAELRSGVHGATKQPPRPR